jgi:hypothetical protein
VVIVIAVLAHEEENRYDSRRQVEQMLKKYTQYKKSMNVLPACVPSYEERVQGGEQEYISSTEKFAFVRMERRALVDGIEFVLLLLSDEERDLIEETYFHEYRPKINIIWQRLNLTKSSYYRQKEMILDKFADLLQVV